MLERAKLFKAPVESGTCLRFEVGDYIRKQEATVYVS